MHVRTLLKEKARPVYTMNCNQSVDDAINLMTAKKVSALIVTEDDQPVGIFAERDVFRFYLTDQTAVPSKIKLKNAMTNKIIAADPADEITAVTALMINADIKHLPVVEEKKIVAMLTLKDLIQHQIEYLKKEVQQLKDYIDDLHAAGID